MNRFRTLGWLILPVLTLALLVSSCGGKKKKKEPVAAEQGFQLNACPVARIEITPYKSEDEGVTIGSMAEVKLTATAYDAEGKVMDVPLSWRFRRPDTCGVNTAGGHKLEMVDSNHAIFRASGLAQGDFMIIAEDQGCNLSSKDTPMYVEGLSWVRVYNRPGAEVSCGRMRATYGDEIDRMGDERVMASSKVTLVAEITGPKNTPSKYRVRFYYNDKPAPEVQPLHRDLDLEPDSTGHRHFRALLPLYLTPGDYCVRYELLKGKELVCGSGTERFKAK